MPKNSEFAKPKRRVFAELDPINPRGNGVQLLNQATNLPVKRTFDGAIKSSDNIPENKKSVSIKVENDENFLPKPQPNKSLQNMQSTQQGRPKTVMESVPNTFSPFMVSPFSFPFPHMMPNAFQQQQNLCMLGLQWQLRQALEAQQTARSSPNLLSSANTAFKPVGGHQPAAKKPFGTSQTNR
jgi:hypothetical protein